MRWLLLLLVFCVGCGPLHYVRKNPIEPPKPIEAPELTTPVWQAGVDCGRFTFDNMSSSWKEEPWAQLGGELDTVEPGDTHPSVGENGLVRCRSVSIAPSVWVVSREARDRYPMMRKQLILWSDYSERAANRHQKESEEIAELLKMARRRQVEAAFIGAGVGASATTLAILLIFFSLR